ncbi:MAG: cyclase family protein [Weeksellaceae bacterium]
MQYTEIIDISLPLSATTIAYPGNPAIEIESMPSSTGTSVLSKLTLSSHTGTHLDAPSHAIPGSASLEQIDLMTLIGTCRIIDCSSEKESISKMFLETSQIKKGERILLKTSNSARGFETFYPDFMFLSPEGAQYLAEQEVAMVGIDSLSIKQKGSTDNTPHTHLLEKNIPILEGINLAAVDAGTYDLIVLPLRFIGLDGSPARAVLLR